MQIKRSELIINKRGAIYHLNLLPEETGDTIILVGDPGRVKQVSAFFDKVEFKTANREFITHTGLIGNKKISVISSGIGTDNIDIVMNELDALVNVDLKNQTINKKKKSLRIVRIGTCGSLQSEVPVDTFVVSEYGIGLDGLLYYYKHKGVNNINMSKAFARHMQWNKNLSVPYTVKGNNQLIKLLGKGNHTGSTLTATGFYGPQGRIVRAELPDNNFIKKINAFKHGNTKVMNFEMETSAIYALGKILGHDTCTICSVVANRINGTFSNNYQHFIKKMIQQCLERLTQ